MSQDFEASSQKTVVKRIVAPNCEFFVDVIKRVDGFFQFLVGEIRLDPDEELNYESYISNTHSGIFSEAVIAEREARIVLSKVCKDKFQKL
jgi:hypothetical protein